jgi:hypothetical protein
LELEEDMYGSHNSFDYGDMAIDSYQDGTNRRSRQNTLQALGRGRRAASKKRSSRKRLGPQILGISHRRNHKWAW